MTDNEWMAERRRRMDELLAASGTGRERADDEPPDAATPAARARRGKWYTDLLALALMLTASWLLISTALTIARFTGNDLGAADRRGVATVERCTRQGPVTLFHGFGWYDRCTVSIRWNAGGSSRLTMSTPGFFHGERVGDTFEIGENTGTRGRVGYSRAAVPDRSWVTVIAVVVAIIGALPLLGVVAFLRQSLKRLFRRPSGSV